MKCKECGKREATTGPYARFYSHLCEPCHQWCLALHGKNPDGTRKR